MANPRSPPMAPDPPRILVIEDEPLIVQMIEEMVREAGYRVSGVVHTMVMARQEFAKRNFDAVLFDLQIGGRYRPEIADFLLDTGVPFAFVTGYDYLVEPRRQRQCLYQRSVHARTASRPLGKPSRIRITDRRNRSDRIGHAMSTGLRCSFFACPYLIRPLRTCCGPRTHRVLTTPRSVKQDRHSEPKGHVDISLPDEKCFPQSTHHERGVPIRRFPVASYPAAPRQAKRRTI